MRRKYPKREDSTLLICEQARPEVNSKISLLGLYGDEIVFHPKPGQKAPYSVASLAFIVLLRGGAGTFNVSFSITGPNDSVFIPESKMEEHTIQSEQSATWIVVHISGPKFQEFGAYTFRLKLERRLYEYDFKVSAKTK